MKFITTIGEQALDLRRADAARLRVGRVEPETGNLLDYQVEAILYL